MNKKLLVLFAVVSVAACAVLARPWMQQRQAAQRIEAQRLAALQVSNKEKQRAELSKRRKASAAEIFDGATKVEAFRLFSVHRKKPIGKLGRNPYFSKVSVRDSHFAAHLGAIVLKPKQFSKLCIFEPAVNFRVWKNQQFVDTTICFHCSELYITQSDPKLRNIPIEAGDFDSVRPTLLALTKEAFPDDSSIQSIN